ncbi:MAG: signal recognition particle protein Srp19 [Candidatus Bathyarchaeota archaeon]|nr:signal recognition particle protein Srp19 [Candidatus Bathyarchaeota archaeon]MDW8040814.1 signal recognition particle subunit SRP19/SEC65 family protein [Nitrososphaerota archaeon]
MRKQDKVILWPAYFDSTKTRGEGRKIPKNLAVPSPKISDLKEAAEKIGLEHELVPDACYPKTPWLKTGMLLVAKKEPKNQILKKVAKQLQKIRASQL